MTGGIAQNVRVDSGVSRGGILGVLHQQGYAALTGHGAVAETAIEIGDILGILVGAGGQHGSDRAAAKLVTGAAHALQPCLRAVGDGSAEALEPGENGQMAACRVVNGVGEAESAAGSGPLLADDLLERGDLRHGAVGGADGTAHHRCVAFVNDKAAVPERVDAAEKLHLTEPVQFSIEAQLDVPGGKICRSQGQRFPLVCNQSADAGDAQVGLAGRGGGVGLFGENDAGVGAAEGEGVGHNVFQGLGPGGIYHAVQITGLFRQRRQIRFRVAGGGQDGVFRQRFHAQHSLHRARSAQTVAGHGLGGADRGRRALKQRVQRQEFRRVVFGGARYRER